MKEIFLQPLKILVFAVKVWYTLLCVNNLPSARMAFPAGRPAIGRKKGSTVKSGHRLTAWASSARGNGSFGSAWLQGSRREAALFVLPADVVRSFSVP